jgi:predicted dehydrogenase
MFTQQARRGDVRTRKETGGGALYDMGIYCVNAARCLFRAEPSEVFGYQTHDDDRFRDVDGSTFATMRFRDGRIAQFVCSQGLADLSSYCVIGTEGHLLLEPAYDYAEELKAVLTVHGRSTTTLYPKHDQFAPEFIHFSECILDDEEPEPSAEEGIADIRVLEAIAGAALSGRPARLAPFLRRRYPSIELRQVKPPVEKPEPIHAQPPTSG